MLGIRRTPLVRYVLVRTAQKTTRKGKEPEAHRRASLAAPSSVEVAQIERPVGNRGSATLIDWTDLPRQSTVALEDLYCLQGRGFEGVLATKRLLDSTKQAQLIVP